MNNTLGALIKNVSNLADGTGKPCAGHVKLNGSEDGFSTVELFNPRLNIGAEPPMGSVNHECGVTISNYISWMWI